MGNRYICDKCGRDVTRIGIGKIIKGESRKECDVCICKECHTATKTIKKDKLNVRAFLRNLD